MSTTEIEIIGGDSKHDMFAQLFDIGRTDRHDLRFKLKLRLPNLFGVKVTMPELELAIWINGIRATNGTGDDWTLHGTMSREDFARLGILGEEFCEHRSFCGPYNTRTRRGSLKAEKSCMDRFKHPMHAAHSH